MEKEESREKKAPPIPDGIYFLKKIGDDVLFFAADNAPIFKDKKEGVPPCSSESEYSQN